MGISCACEYPDYDPEWYWEVHDESFILDTTRFRKCVSCKANMEVGESVYTAYKEFNEMYALKGCRGFS
jgi:hypothetical protein